MEEFRRKRNDGVHKWLVFTSAFITVACNIGFCLTMGTLFVAIMEEFNTTRAKSAAMQSTLLGAFLGSGIVTGPLVKRYGCRVSGLVGSVCVSFGIMASYFASSITFMIVSIGIVAGVGFSAMYISATAITEKSFDGKRKMLMLSILVSASGVGGMIYPYMLVYLNDIYGLNGTFLLVGAICSHSIPSCLLWTEDEYRTQPNELEGNDCPKELTSSDSKVSNNPQEKNIIQSERNIATSFNNSSSAFENQWDIRRTSRDDFAELGRSVCIMERQSGVNSNGGNLMINVIEDKIQPFTALESFMSLIRNKSFWVFTIATSFAFPIFAVLIICIVDIFTDKGYTKSDANLGLILFSMLGILGRLFPGIIQTTKLPTLAVPIIASFVTSLLLLVIILVSNVTITLASCAMLGICNGVFVAVLTLVPISLFGRENLPTAMGLIFCITGIPNSAVAPITGLIRDKTNSYNAALYSAVGCLIIACALYIVAHVLHETDRKSKRKVEKRTSVFYVTKFLRFGNTYNGT